MLAPHSERVAAIILSPSYDHMRSDSRVYTHICSVSFSLSLMYPDTLFPSSLQYLGRLDVLLQKKASLNIYNCAALRRIEQRYSWTHEVDVSVCTKDTVHDLKSET